MAQNAFKTAIREAVAYFAKRGYTSQHDLDRWSQRIAEAAKISMVSTAVAHEMLTRHLGAIYKRAMRSIPQKVEELQVKTAQRMTPEIYFRRVETAPQIQMQMRNELDRRISASVGLIKIRREEAVAATLRRFQGWASSVPPGGTPAPQEPERTLLAKEYKQVRYEVNRLNIDQGHKLNASLRATYAMGVGAIAAIWRSNWRQINYDYREDHKERDGKYYAIRDNWAIKAGLMKPGPAGYSDQITQPAEEVYCRCRFEYVVNLIDLPTDMLTAKGRKALNVMEELNGSAP